MVRLFERRDPEALATRRRAGGRLPTSAEFASAIVRATKESRDTTVRHLCGRAGLPVMARDGQRAVPLIVEAGTEALASVFDRGTQPFAVLLPGTLEAHPANTHWDHS